MAWVKDVPPESASPAIREIYDGIREKFGMLPNYFTALGRSQPLLEAQLAIDPAIMEGGVLPRKIKEQIGLVVSGINTSSYCVALHMQLLTTYGIEKRFARTLAVDYANAAVEPKLLAMFRFADKLTRRSADVDQGDYDAPRAAGWQEAEIFEAAVAIAYFNFLNRVSIGLGLVADF